MYFCFMANITVEIEKEAVKSLKEKLTKKYGTKKAFITRLQKDLTEDFELDINYMVLYRFFNTKGKMHRDTYGGRIYEACCVIIS